MELALLHTDDHQYPRCGIFIKHASPKVWLEEITRMQLKLSECTLYPCPALEANSISGVLVIFKSAQQKIDIQRNMCVLKAHTGFYIPEFTRLNMSLTPDEFTKITQGKPHFFHHEFGLIELTEEVRWETLLQFPEEAFPAIEKPAKGVQIPMNVTAFSVEIEEAETEKELENSLGNEKVNTKDLPFDMKKVLEGNNKEVEKYLKYIEKNPDAALKMAVPLDMLGTSRGKAFAQYRFKSNFFESFGFGNASEQTKTGIKTVFGILAIIAIFWLGLLVVDTYKQNQVVVKPGTGTVTISPKIDQEKLTAEEKKILSLDQKYLDSIQKESESGSADGSNGNLKTSEKPKDATLKNTLLTIIYILVVGIIILFIIQWTRKRSKKKVEQNNNSSWMNLPEESSFFSFDEEEKEENKYNGFSFYFGGNELSLISKTIIILMILAVVAYLLYPMIANKNTKTIFIIIAIGFIIRMLYDLLNKNKLYSDD
ncbi:hypothetical protein C8N46_102280 [Kordia periserrulae]|uniref:MoxR-vWA-beta-propeller ternary system domain-containing protein n=1 Tax=Kordia periserrulae TaxID=701523 RepID=A0A2T6C3I9_9FLAO|nr:hypothetical protein [Kordia periserrulae]PTX62880.1 hypothetical protein C8N46_102280 [Kordia periserrulae]